MKFSRLAVAILASSLASFSYAQVTLTGTSYTQNFNSLGSGLPTGWSVYTSATLSSLGAAGTFTSTATAWSGATVGTDFRNIASSDIATSSNSTTQNNDVNRAFGWRPTGTNSATVSPAREGALLLALSNTTGFHNFGLSVSLFTTNDVTNNQTYQLEYRVGNSGNFTSLGTYTTGAPFNSSTLTANSVTLSALDNQSSTVYIRLRGTTTTGSTSLDTLGIDDFTLTYAATAIPEPATYAVIFGVVVLAGVAWRRQRLKLSA